MKRITFQIPLRRFVGGDEVKLLRRVLINSLGISDETLLKAVAKSELGNFGYVRFVTTTEQFVDFLVARNQYGVANMFAELYARDVDGPQGRDKAPAIETKEAVLAAVAAERDKQAKAENLAKGYGMSSPRFKVWERDANRPTWHVAGYSDSDDPEAVAEAVGRFKYHGAWTGRMPSSPSLTDNALQLGKTRKVFEQIREAVDRGEDAIIVKPDGGYVHIRHEKGTKYVFPNVPLIPDKTAVFDDTVPAALALLREIADKFSPNYVASYNQRKDFKRRAEEILAAPTLRAPVRKPDAFGHVVTYPTGEGSDGRMIVSAVGGTKTRAWWNFFGGFIRFGHGDRYSEADMQKFRREREEKGFRVKKVAIYFRD